MPPGSTGLSIPLDLGPLLQAIGAVTSATVFAGLVWYLITRGLPSLQTRFEESLDKIIAANCEQAKETRDCHARLCADQRDACKKELESVTSLYERQMERVWQAYSSQGGRGPGP